MPIPWQTAIEKLLDLETKMTSVTKHSSNSKKPALR